MVMKRMFPPISYGAIKAHPRPHGHRESDACKSVATAMMTAPQAHFGLRFWLMAKPGSRKLRETRHMFSAVRLSHRSGRG
jgi:hypothetical protein